MIVERLPERAEPWDLCVVGSGPVGMAMALECERLGLSVLVLEAGDVADGSHDAEAARAHIRDESRHAPMEIAVRRGFGGTSWLWGGRCVPFDPIDFVARSYVPDSGWPIGPDELRPFSARAAEILLCGSDRFEVSAEPLPSTFSGVSIARLERWATESRIALVHRTAIEGSERVVLCGRSPVVDLALDGAAAAVDGVVVATSEGRTTIRARRIVLALGGVETTRLLLAVRRDRPELFGGPDGALGRYYMGHISGKIADIVFADARTAAAFDYQRDATGAYVRRRFTIDEAVQRERRILNTAFWPDNPPFYEASHRSGVLSAIFLALAFPPVGRRLIGEGMRLYHIGPRPRRIGAHIRNLVMDVPGTLRDTLKLFRERFIAKPRKPAPLVLSADGRYALAYHAEQEPDRASRITLADEADRHGVPRASIDLRFTEADVRSVLAAHRVLDEALQATGIGRIEYRYPADRLAERVLAQASDGYHQVGTTRMGVDPATSVVDADLRVHGLTNLYVASSSVFPTTGQANSTYLAVMLGLRLVSRLQSLDASGSSV